MFELNRSDINSCQRAEERFHATDWMTLITSRFLSNTSRNKNKQKLSKKQKTKTSMDSLEVLSMLYAWLLLQFLNDFLQLQTEAIHCLAFSRSQYFIIFVESNAVKVAIMQA